MSRAAAAGEPWVVKVPFIFPFGQEGGIRNKLWWCSGTWEMARGGVWAWNGTAEKRDKGGRWKMSLRVSLSLSEKTGLPELEMQGHFSDY